MTRTKTRATANWPNNAVSVLDYGAVGDGINDDTAAIQNALDENNYLYFPAGVYAVTSITIDNSKHFFGWPEFRGIATTPTTAVINLIGLRCTFQFLSVDQNFNTNYTAAIHWYSRSQSQPAQYNRFYSLKLDNCLIGILFGQLVGTPVQDAPQSENTITHMVTRGCSNPIYMNQSNGFLFIGESTISSIKNEWPNDNWDPSETAVIKNYLGILRISNSEILKTDTQEGEGILVDAGDVSFDNCTFEIASRNVLIHNNGRFHSGGSKFYMANATDAFARHDGKLLRMESCSVERAVGAAPSARGFIEYGDPLGKVYLSNIDLKNFLSSTLINSGASPFTFNIPVNYHITGLVSEPTDVSLGVIIPSNIAAISPLIARGVDVACDTLDGWYYKLDYGSGSSYDLDTDVPTTPVTEPEYTSSIKLVATGVAYVSTIDDTSLDTVKETGIRCTDRQRFLVSGWVKNTDQGTLNVGVLAADSTGVVTFRDSFRPLGGDWNYFQVLYQATAGDRYIGVAMRAVENTANITGVSLIAL